MGGQIDRLRQTEMDRQTELSIQILFYMMLYGSHYYSI